MENISPREITAAPTAISGEKIAISGETNAPGYAPSGSATLNDFNQEETRFGFGANWEQFAKLIDESRIESARNALVKYLGRDDLTGEGEPIPPTQKSYPICRSLCTHEVSRLDVGAT